jgi:hypothetical protein
MADVLLPGSAFDLDGHMAEAAIRASGSRRSPGNVSPGPPALRRVTRIIRRSGRLARLIIHAIGSRDAVAGAAGAQHGSRGRYPA